MFSHFSVHTGGSQETYLEVNRSGPCKNSDYSTDSLERWQNQEDKHGVREPGDMINSQMHSSGVANQTL